MDGVGHQGEVFIEDYVTVSQAAQLTNYAPSWISELCRRGRIKGVRRVGYAYLIPTPVTILKEQCKRYDSHPQTTVEE